MNIHIVTSNQGKFREMCCMVEPLGHSVVREEIPYPEIQADTLREVVRFGADWIRDHDDRPWMDDPGHGFIIDDSGIFIRALKDFPGVYSKHAYFSIGKPGILRLMDGVEHREAIFRTALLFSTPGEHSLFEGESRGTITTDERGSLGFGYDPIFMPRGSHRTFAEMDVEEKNSFSHRGRAMQRFLDFLGGTER